jgi:predicted N-acetyltransferase YhbS
MKTIDTEKIFDIEGREHLLDFAFGPKRHEKTCERLREGRMPAEGLAFVIRAYDRVVGTVRLWHVAARNVPFLMLGPLAIDPLMRGAGFGGMMMNHALARATELGHRAVFLVGDEAYYSRFGFSRTAAEKLVLPGPVDANRLLAKELVPGGLFGIRGLVRATGAMPLHPVKTTPEWVLRRAA